jgi:hypothetical protein
MKILKGVIVLLAIFLIYQVSTIILNADLFEGFTISSIFQQEGGGFFALFLIITFAIVIYLIFRYVPRRYS